jgi:hypothetical protein
MEPKEKIKSQAKYTIGYLEAADKHSFMAGVSVALSKAEEHYEKELESTKRELEMYRFYYESTKNDLSTLSSIVIRYVK